MQPREGLFHSPGVFSGITILRLRRNGALPHRRDVVSALPAELSAPKGLHVGLGLAPALLPREGPTTRFPSTQAQVLVQGTHLPRRTQTPVPSITQATVRPRVPAEEAPQ